MGATRFQSIQGFWAQLLAQALTARDVLSVGSLAKDLLGGAVAESASRSLTANQQRAGLRSVAEIIAECRIATGSALPEVARTASVDGFLMFGENSSESVAGSELVGCAFRCDSTEPVA